MYLNRIANKKSQFAFISYNIVRFNSVLLYKNDFLKMYWMLCIQNDIVFLDQTVDGAAIDSALIRGLRNVAGIFFEIMQ